MRPTGETEIPLTSAFITDEPRPLLLRVGMSVGSLVVHTILLGTAILAPIWFTDTLDSRAYTSTMVVAPPTAPPAPYRAVAATSTARARLRRSTFVTARGTLLFPRIIPREVAMVNDAPSLTEVEGVIGGVPGGMLGAPLSGILGEIFESAPPPAPIPQPPAVPQPRAPVRVGPHVQPPSIIYRVEPVYPALAKQARVEGDVVISVIIDTKGNVVEMKAVSGNPLLMKSALDAVEKWRYQPTLLNGQPVDIDMTITVTFELGR
jgi:protein TonB